MLGLGLQGRREGEEKRAREEWRTGKKVKRTCMPLVLLSAQKLTNKQMGGTKLFPKTTEMEIVQISGGEEHSNILGGELTCLNNTMTKRRNSRQDISYLFACRDDSEAMRSTVWVGCKGLVGDCSEMN